MTTTVLLLPLLLAQAIGLVFGIVIIVGAVKMMRLKSHGFATMASVLALLPCGPAWLLGLPMGIWSLLVLGRPDVKAGFRAKQRKPAPASSRPETLMSQWLIVRRNAALGVCVLGAALALVPWAEYRAVFPHTLIDPKYIYTDGTFDYRSGIWADQLAHGYATWQGLAACGTFFILGCVFLSTLHSRGAAPWQYASLIIASFAIAGIAMHAILERPRIIDTPIQWAKETPELQAEHRAERGTMSDREFLRRKLSENFVRLERSQQPGPYLALALAGCLFMFGLAEFLAFTRARRIVGDEGKRVHPNGSQVQLQPPDAKLRHPGLT